MPAQPAIANSERLISLDAFRGFVILSMIWVNYLAGMPGIAYWLEHAGARADGITLPDLVFPGFLFIVGIAIPLALHKARGQFGPALLLRLCWRAASLMVAGVVLANAYRYDEDAAALPRALYLLLFYGAMILLWRAQPGRRWTVYAGGALMLALLLAFRGKTDADFDSVWLQPGWWGILGMIGWSYLLCSLVYLACGGERAALMAALGMMLALYMGDAAGALDFLPAQLGRWFHIGQLFGSTSANVLAGTVVGTLFVREGGAVLSHRRRIGFMGWFALALLTAGLLLRPYHQLTSSPP